MIRTALIVATCLSLASTLAAQPGPRRYEVDTNASQVYAVTHRSGLLGFLGHEHAIIPDRWSASLCYDSNGQTSAAARIEVDARSLIIDSDSARQLAGIGGGPGDDDRREIQAKMTGPRFLHVEEFPSIVFEADSVSGDGPADLVAHGRLTIRENTRAFDVPIQIEDTQDQLTRFSAELRFRLSNFGIERERVAGVVNVADEVDLHVRLLARPTPGRCPG